MAEPGIAYRVIVAAFLAISIRNVWTISRGDGELALEERIGHRLFGRAWLRARPVTAVSGLLFFSGLLFIHVMPRTLVLLVIAVVASTSLINLFVFFFNAPRFLIPSKRRDEESLGGYFWRRVVLGNRC